MHRFFSVAGNIAGGIAILSQADTDHVRVLRLKLGERLIICDGNGTDYECRITNLKGTVEAEILGSSPTVSEPTVSCTVLSAFPKGSKAETIVRSCTEAGAVRFIFFNSERCVSVQTRRGVEAKLDRWRRIAREAAMQSGRGVVPDVEAAMNFGEALDIAGQADLPLMMYETGERLTMREALDSAENYGTVSIITGPEGGFEPYEALAASYAGVRLCSMGPRILRAENAPVCALSAVLYQTGNM